MEVQTNLKCRTVTHQVFPGIQILYHDFHSEVASLGQFVQNDKNCFEIIHCREGRMECDIENEFCYISPGDLLVVKRSYRNNKVYFPLNHYHGITVRIDIEKSPKCLSCFLKDVAVQPALIANRFCNRKPYFIARANPSFEHIYSELYTVPKEIQQGYFKVKILELMLFLSVFHNVDESDIRRIPPHQVKLAKEVCQYLTNHMDERVTIERVSDIFNTSPTNIKVAVKAVYGISFYSFTKAQKMESAAYMLEYSDKSVIEIAGEHGYDNGSKFASAFRSVKGVTPSEYRQINKKYI